MPTLTPTHVQIIQTAHQRRKESNPRYSLRAFASFLGLHPSALSRILSGKQDLSVQCALQIMRKLKLKDEELELFIFSVAQEKSRQTFATLCEGTLFSKLADAPVLSVPGAAIDELKGTIEALNKANQLFRSAANFSPNLLWKTEPDGTTSWYNDRWVEYTGQTSEQATGRGWIEALHPEDREDCTREYKEAVQARRALEQQHRIWGVHGGFRWFLVRAAPVCDDSGKVIHMYGSATDIHNLKTSILEKADTAK